MKKKERERERENKKEKKKKQEMSTNCYFCGTAVNDYICIVECVCIPCASKLMIPEVIDIMRSKGYYWDEDSESFLDQSANGIIIEESDGKFKVRYDNGIEQWVNRDELCAIESKPATSRPWHGSSPEFPIMI